MPEDEIVGQEAEDTLSTDEPQVDDTAFQPEGDEPEPEGDEPDTQQAAESAYEQRLAALEQRNAQLEATLRADQQRQLAPPIQPDFFRKSEDQWTTKDWREYNQFVVQQQLQRVTEEQNWRGRLSADALGKDNDYDSVMNRYVPLISHDPTNLEILQQLDPPARYLMAFVHEIFEKGGRDLVKTVKALRNAIGARQEGARDVTRNLRNASKGAALKVFQGQKGAQRLSPKSIDRMSPEDIEAMSDEQILNISRRAGR